MDFAAIKGFKDVLPGEISTWQRLESMAREIFRSFGFQEIRPPLLEMTEQLAADMSSRAKKVTLDHLIEGGVDIIKNATVTEVSKSEIRFEKAGVIQKMKGFDHIIFALGTVPERNLIDQAGDMGIPTYTIGDCVKPRRVLEAIREGFDIAIDI